MVFKSTVFQLSAAETLSSLMPNLILLITEMTGVVNKKQFKTYGIYMYHTHYI